MDAVILSSTVRVAIRAAFDITMSKYNATNPYFEELYSAFRGEFVNNLRRIMYVCVLPVVKEENFRNFYSLFIPKQWIVVPSVTQPGNPLGVAFLDNSRSIRFKGLAEYNIVLSSSMFYYRSDKDKPLNSTEQALYRTYMKAGMSIERTHIPVDYEMLAMRDILNRMDTLVKGDI